MRSNSKSTPAKVHTNLPCKVFELWMSESSRGSKCKRMFSPTGKNMSPKIFLRQKLYKQICVVHSYVANIFMSEENHIPAYTGSTISMRMKDS